jgi:GGDEF domain-containing protein
MSERPETHGRSAKKGFPDRVMTAGLARLIDMPMFSALTFRRNASGVAQGIHQAPDLPERVRLALPLRFDAVAEALVAGRDVVGACTVVGRDVARDGAALGEALSALRSTYQLVLGGAPTFEATEALSVAWSEATLEYLHDLSCEDPLTGLASLAHVRSRLGEIYREAEITDAVVPRTHALVIVELLFPRGVAAEPGHHFTRAMRLVQISEALRAVFPGGQTLGRLGLDRAVAVVPRTADLGVSVALVRDFLTGMDFGDTGGAADADVRVWIEGLPRSTDSATRLLDDLAR